MKTLTTACTPDLAVINKEGWTMGWYAIKKKTDRRWTAYKLDILPPLKRGYEVLGPFKSYIATIIAANENNKTNRR